MEKKKWGEKKKEKKKTHLGQSLKHDVDFWMPFLSMHQFWYRQCVYFLIVIFSITLDVVCD